MLCAGGKTGGAIWGCLHFLAPPFASGQKVEKVNLNDCLKKHCSYSPRMLKQVTPDRQENNK
jgi:hypothetical protein